MAVSTGRGASFVKRVYPARILGLGLGFIAVAGATAPLDYPLAMWVLMLFNGFIWPHIAYQLALRSKTPYITEHRNFLVDSFSGGFWLVAMGFNPLPATMMMMMLWMNNITAGGPVLFAKGLVFSLLGIIPGILFLGTPLYIDSSTPIVLASMPLLLVFPVMVGAMTYRLAIRLHQQKQVLQNLSRTDALTGLYNRGYWEARAQEEFDRSRHSGTITSLILLDVDHFKQVNDAYGHSTGDAILEQMTQLITQQVRHVDVAGRYGGEEFAILLPDTNKESALAVAERLRTVVASNPFHDVSAEKSLQLNTTVSIGIADSVDIPNFSEWVRAADNALYAAKRNGRNRTVCHRARRAVNSEAPVLESSM